VTTHRPIAWDIRAVKRRPRYTPASDFDKYFASSGFSSVKQPEEVDAFVSDTDDMFFEGIYGIDPRVMAMFDLHIPDSTPAHYNHMSDHQVNAISTASVGLLDSNEAWAALFHDNRTSADVTIPSHLREGLLYIGPLISPTAADPLPNVHRVAASDREPDIAPAPLASPSSEPIVVPTEIFPPSRSGRHRLVPAVPPVAHVVPRRSTHHRLLLLI
jgi:hypothetical protein